MASNVDDVMKSYKHLLKLNKSLPKDKQLSKNQIARFRYRMKRCLNLIVNNKVCFKSLLKSIVDAYKVFGVTLKLKQTF